jgi:membrane-bound lytic murein transglycosylase D
MNKLLTITGFATLLVLGGCASTTQDSAPVTEATPKVEPTPVVVTPPAAPVVSTPAPVVTAPTAPATTHVVAKEDTLFNISKRYGVTVKQLQTWNKLKGNSIKVGQTLKVVAP